MRNSNLPSLFKFMPEAGRRQAIAGTRPIHEAVAVSADADVPREQPSAGPSRLAATDSDDASSVVLDRPLQTSRKGKEQAAEPKRKSKAVPSLIDMAEEAAAKRDFTPPPEQGEL
jgi:hypothetical protein